MLTKNFYAIQASLLFRGGTFPVTKSDGTEANIVFYHSGSSYFAYAFNGGNVTAYVGVGYINVGSGTTPATVNDYALETPITIGFSASISSFVSAQDSGAEIVYKIILNNPASAGPMTVSEIGYYGRGYTSASSGGAIPLLMDRTVLDEPVTIPAGESRTITYTVRLNRPV